MGKYWCGLATYWPVIWMLCLCETRVEIREPILSWCFIHDAVSCNPALSLRCQVSVPTKHFRKVLTMSVVFLAVFFLNLLLGGEDRWGIVIHIPSYVKHSVLFVWSACSLVVHSHGKRWLFWIRSKWGKLAFGSGVFPAPRALVSLVSICILWLWQMGSISTYKNGSTNSSPMVHS